jgi:DNA-binding transcriptional MerR regulator
LPLTNIQQRCIFLIDPSVLITSICVRKGVKMERRNYTIGDFARLLGVSPRTIDFYTRQGLLHPEQSSHGHGYRRYTEGDRSRLALIKQLQARKFSLQEISQILNSSSGQKSTSAAQTLEQVMIDLDRLQNLIQKSRSSASFGDPSAMRVAATEALQKATGLCSLLVTLLQDMPL